MQTEDILLFIEEQLIKSTQDIKDMLIERDEGEDVFFTVLRDGSKKDCLLTKSSGSLGINVRKLLRKRRSLLRKRLSKKELI